MILPMLELSDARGHPAPWMALWQHHPVLVLVAHPGCERCHEVLAAFQRYRGELSEDATRAIAIVDAPPDEVPDDVIVLVDSDGRFASKIGGAGRLLATDQFFDIRRSLDTHRGSSDEVIRDALGWVELSLTECPECGVGTW